MYVSEDFGTKVSKFVGAAKFEREKVCGQASFWSYTINLTKHKKGLCHRCMTQPPCYDVINDLLFFLDLAAHDQVSRGSGDEHGGEGADDDTEDHGEGEALDAGAAEEENDHQNDERRY